MGIEEVMDTGQRRSRTTATGKLNQTVVTVDKHLRNCFSTAGIKPVVFLT